MKIEVNTPMVSAHLTGIDTYTPVFDGVEMEVECGNPEITLRNLSNLIRPVRQPIAFHASHGQILVIFDSGETYLATGFSYGSLVEEVCRFAEFASKHGFGNVEELQCHLKGIDVSWSGWLPIFQKQVPDEWF
jgi:hypothetical protein